MHDCEIKSYFVDFHNRNIIFNLDDKLGIKFIDVQLFDFEREVCGSIIYDITDNDIDVFFDKNIDFFRKNSNYIFPLIGENCIEKFKCQIEQKKFKCYTIDSSYGLCGFIIAKKIIKYAL